MAPRGRVDLARLAHALNQTAELRRALGEQLLRVVWTDPLEDVLKLKHLLHRATLRHERLQRRLDALKGDDDGKSYPSRP